MIKRQQWFKRHKYGWGWIPFSWQGWLVTFFFAVIIVLTVLSFGKETTILEAVISFVVPGLLFVSICYMTEKKE